MLTDAKETKKANYTRNRPKKRAKTGTHRLQAPAG